MVESCEMQGWFVSEGGRWASAGGIPHFPCLGSQGACEGDLAALCSRALLKMEDPSTFSCPFLQSSAGVMQAFATNPDEKVAIVALSLRNPSSHPSTEPRGAFSFQDVTSPNQSSAPYRAFNTRQMDSE